MAIMLRLAAALAASALALACGPSRPPPPTPKPAGPPPLPVGTAQFAVNATPTRVLPAILWYPAQTAGPTRPPIRGQKRPVVLMSHGYNGRMEHAAFLAERLAAAGYVVAAVDHQNDGAAMALQRPVDITKLLDRISERDPEPTWLPDLLDLNHIAVYGHSFGGYTALALAGAQIGPNAEWTAHCTAVPTALDCPTPSPKQMKTQSLRDPRIDFTIAATPSGFFQFGRAGTAAIDTPVLLLTAGKDQLTPPAEYARPLFEHMTRSRWYVELSLAGHMTFVDLCDKIDKLPSPFKEEVQAECAPDAPLPLATAHDLIADLVLAALDHQFKKAPAPDFAAIAKARGVAVRADAAN
jgi:predicted dienelactone hydrolase